MEGRLALFSPVGFALCARAINFAAFAAFGIDNLQAEAGQRRISETSLLNLR